MDEELLPVSALQHFVFCPRQCALIHLEQAWSDNCLTAEGQLLHRRVESAESTTRGDVQIRRSVPLSCRRLGLVGKADVVEVHREPDGRERIVPVEYKRGRSKPHDADRVQLCAQAMSLEEASGQPVPEGALYYGEPKRREIVAFTAALRARTEQVAAATRKMIQDGRTPPPVFGPHCRSCSLVDICRPTLAQSRSAQAWIEAVRSER
jgi:CRISPR-associated exonuclease Cas4